jgi:hypothetical protein
MHASRKTNGFEKAMLQYEAEGRAIREKTARLRALRLDKEAAEKKRRGRGGLQSALGCQKKVKHGCS